MLTLCSKRMLLVLMGCLLSVSVGCKPKTNLIPVSGVVTINGKAAANINVQFMPDIEQKNSGPTSHASTDADGKFELHVLQTNELGAVPGPHRVIFADLDEERPAQGEVAKKPPRLNSTLTTASGGMRVVVEKDNPITLNIVN